MNCQQVERLLALDDLDRSVDPGKLADHLEACVRCGADFPEVRFLLRHRSATVTPAASRALHAAGWLVAAGLLMAAAISLLQITPPPSTPATVASAEVHHVRVLPATVSLVETHTIRFGPGTERRTELRQTTWSPTRNLPSD